jgi:hypothetical protein
MTRTNNLRRWAGRLLTFAFLALVAWLIAWRAQSIEWDQVGEALQRYRASTLLVAAGLTALSYALYAGYELLGRAYTRHRMPRRRVVAIAMVSYAFNLNFGAWIGGIGFRYRLYSRNGLAAGLTTRILAMSLATNWLGYLCLAGMAFLLGMLPLPPDWKLGAGATRLLGAGLLLAAIAYLALCGWSRQRSWKVRGTELHLPPLPMALTQASLSIANWLVIGGVMFVLLGARVPFHVVLAVLLVAAVAGVVTHIPAGLGVIEAVFFAFLAGNVPEGQLVAALLAYRATYYLAPLAMALPGYLMLEARARSDRRAHRSHAHHQPL